jgi:hypothetical protein
MPCSLPRWIEQVLVGFFLVRAAFPVNGRVGIHDFTFGACSSVTRVTACKRLAYTVSDISHLRCNEGGSSFLHAIIAGPAPKGEREILKVIPTFAPRRDILSIELVQIVSQIKGFDKMLSSDNPCQVMIDAAS